MYEKIYEVERLLREFFKKNNYHADDIYPSNETTIAIDITWGDWKHDHLYCDYLVETFLEDKSLTLVYKTTHITEDDGSDAYSATHYYNIHGL